ncbi:MAG TPA: ATP-dependent Clp protease proteolytic subunit, partial [Clostridia bacterium]|nr:ATP-dependent Clp protease proteolytic subunit [Clostridia bacterium]
MNERFIPTIITNINGVEQITDSVNIDFMRRRIYLVGEIDSTSSTAMLSMLGYLSNKSSDDIELFINSPGGAIQDGL